MVAYLPCVLRGDYDELMKQTAAAEARIRQIAKQFLTQEQVDTVIAPPAK